jgi:hypothetical protein
MKRPATEADVEARNLLRGLEGPCSFRQTSLRSFDLQSDAGWVGAAVHRGPTGRGRLGGAFPGLRPLWRTPSGAILLRSLREGHLRCGIRGGG